METIQLCNEDLNVHLFENVKYFMIAEGGAMGTPGDIHFLTADRRCYQMNYVYGGIDFRKLESVFPVLEKCDFGMFGEDSIVPKGWQYVYLGMGNHLLVEKSVYSKFAEIIGKFDKPDHVYQSWFQAALDTLSQRKEHLILDYDTDRDNSVRYVLGKYDNNPLIVFGINPSTASEEENDNTISIVETIANRRGNDGYIMFNIYPVRATEIDDNFPKAADEDLVEKNLRCISERVDEGSTVIAAWGTKICKRKYFWDSLVRINEVMKAKSVKWICLEETQEGHPHHPTRLSYDKMIFAPFDMDKYIEKMKMR